MEDCNMLRVSVVPGLVLGISSRTATKLGSPVDPGKSWSSLLKSKVRIEKGKSCENTKSITVDNRLNLVSRHQPL